MFENEIKKELKTIYNNNKKIDSELVNIKVAIHSLEKLGSDTKDLEKMLDNVGIEFYKFKEKSKNMIKERLEKMRTEYAKKNNIEFEDYNGYCNRDTWLTIFWVNNCKDNYEYIKGINVNSLSDTEFYKALRKCVYGDIINFNKVDLDEVKANLADEW